MRRIFLGYPRTRLNVCSLSRSYSAGQLRPYTQSRTFRVQQRLGFSAQKHRRLQSDQRSGHNLVARHASSAATMTPEPKSKQSLAEVLTPRLLESVRGLWFQHLTQAELFILPGDEDTKRWFVKNAEFDAACISHFHHVLEAIRTSNATASDILTAVNPSSPLDWLALVLLLDQVPRNCYRGPESGIVFSVFDPLALDIAQRTIAADIPSQNPLIRYRLAYRFWFYLPLMHSEAASVHESAVKEYEAMAKDIESLLLPDSSVSSSDQDAQKCRDVLVERREEAEKFCALSLDFEKRHQDIILRFGRYPHRNEALGRTPTAEEKKYLEDGGETF